MVTGIAAAQAADVYWRDDWTNDYWDSSQGCDPFGTPTSPWWYNGWSGNEARGRPDCWGQHVVHLNNANRPTTILNSGWFKIAQLLFEATCPARTLNNNGDIGIDLYGKIENNVSGAQTFNVPISFQNPVEINPVSGNITLNSNIWNNGNWINVWGNNGKTLALYGVLSDAGGLAVKENSTVILANDNTFSGGIWVEKGTVRLQTHTNAVGTGSVNVGTNATLDINYGAVHVRGVALTLYNGKVSKTVTGSTYWDGAFTNYNSSTVSVSAGNFIIISNMSLNSGTLVFSNVFNSGMNGGTMTGSGNLIKQGLGAFFLFPGTHSGNITMYQGEIRQFTGTMTGSGTLTMSNATTYRTDGTTTRTNTKAIVIKGDVTLGYSGGGALILTGNMSLNSGIRTITCPNTNTISGVISSGGLNKDGVGMLILSADNSYASTNTVSNGVLRISSTWALGSHTAGTIVQSGAALELTGGIATPAEPLSLVGTGINNGGALRNISGNNSYNGPITLTGLTRINSDSGTLQLGANGDVSGAGQTLIVGGTGVVDIWGDLPTGSATFIKDGTGTNTLNYSSATRTWTGPTYINEGVIQLTAANGISDNSAMTISNGATFNMAAGNDTIGSIAGTGTIVMGNSTLTCGGNNSNTVFAGVMSGAGGVLTKTGSGTLTLSGTSTHGGNTTVSAGTLIQNGTNSSSAVTVSSGAFLYGGGQVADLNIFGCVSPGVASNTVGKLKSAAVTLPTNGQIQIDLTAMSGTAGVDWDFLEASGSVTVNANSANRFTIALKGNPTGFNAGQGWTNTIITAGSISGFDATDFTVTTAEFIPSLGGGSFSVDQSGNSIRLIFTPLAGSAPDITVLGTNLAVISDGDTTPQIADGTDFGSVALEGAAKEHTFTITNDGTGLLFIDNVAIGGTHASDFTVTGVPAIHTNNLLLNGDFALSGNPAQLGTAVINNWNTWGTGGWYQNDIDSQMSVKIWWDDTGIYQNFTCATGAVYVFSVQGRHRSSKPLVNRSGVLKAEFYDSGGTPLAAYILDDLKPTDPQDQWIPMSGVCTSPANSVQGRLVLTVTSGAGSDGDAYFDNASVVCMNLLGHSTTTFRVTFDPSAIGARTGTVYITNNVTGKSPYDFVIKGTGAPPDMDVLGTNGAVIADGDTTPTQVDGTDFGTVALSGGSKLHTFMITNTGPCVIRASDIAIGGLHASDFTIAQQTFKTIAYNLIATNPSFEANADAWNMGGNCGVAQEFHGVYAKHGTNFMTAWWENVSHMDIPVTPGSTYVWSAWVTTPAGCAQTMSNLYGLLKMEWRTASDTSISDTQLTFSAGTTHNVQITPGTWKQIAVTSAAPANAAFLRAGWGVWRESWYASGQALFDEMVAYELPGVRGTSTFSIVFDPSEPGTRTATVYITNNTAKNPYDFQIQGKGQSALDDPTGAQAWRDGREMVRLQWTNYLNYGVIVVHRQTNAPTPLEQGVAYNVGDAVGTDGTRVVAKLPEGVWVEHILQPGSTNHYIFYTYDGDYYSPGVADSTNLLQYMPHEIVEEFCYTGGVTQLNGQSRGHGWSGSWNADPAFIITSNDTPDRPEFLYMWPYPDRGGNRIRVPDQGNGIWAVEAYRNFPKVTNGAIYISGRMSVQSNGPNRWCGFTFVTGSTHTVFFGDSWGADGYLGLSDWGSSGTATNRIIGWSAALTNTYLVIGKYDFATRRFSAVSYPGWTNTPSSEPNWGVSSTATGIVSYIDGVGIKAGCSDAVGMSPGECFFDEIRVATSWADLCNATLVWVTNYSVGVSNQVTDGQVTSGAFSVTFWTWDLSSPDHLGYDILNPSGTEILANKVPDFRNWYASNTMMVASDSVHAGYSPGILGFYTTRYSVCSKSGFWQYDLCTLSNGTPMTFTVVDDDTEGPVPTLLYIGTNYTPGAVNTNTTDGDLSSGGMFDIAVLLSDPSGIWYATNDYHNIDALAGNIQPNWDLTNSVNQDFGYDLPFTTFFGGSGAASVTAVVYNVAPINPTNLAMESMWTLTVSADDLDSDRGVWYGSTQPTWSVSYDRATTTNYPLHFWVTDDDKAPPVLAVPQIGMTLGGTNIGNLLKDGDLNDPNQWVLHSALGTILTNSAGEGGGNGILFTIHASDPTNHYGGFHQDYTIKENVSRRYLFSVRAREGVDDFNAAQVVLKFEFLNSANEGLYSTETDNIVTHLTDDWKTFWFSATSPANAAVVRASVHFNTANGTVGTTGRTSMWDSVRLYWADLVDTNPILRVTDGQFVQASAATPFRLNINAYDTDSGLARGTTHLDSQSFISVRNLATNNLANYSAADSSPNTRSVDSSNVWTWTTSLGNVDDYMTQSNIVIATLRDADLDRPNDQLSVSNITAGYFVVVDDDTNYPARGFMEAQELLLNPGFETNGAYWRLDGAPLLDITNYAAETGDYGLMITNYSSQGGGIYAEQFVDVIGGQTYRLSVRARKEGLCNQPGIFVKAEHFSSSGLPDPTWDETNIINSLTTDWQTFSITFDAHANAMSNKIVFMHWAPGARQGYGAVYFDNASFTFASGPPMEVRIGTNVIEGTTADGAASEATNAYYTVTDAMLAGVAPTNPLRFILAAFDADSGLARTDIASAAGSNTFLTVANLTTNNVVNYMASESTPLPTMNTDTNVWRFDSISSATLDSLINAPNGTNEIRLTMKDADFDRLNDQLSVSNALFGVFRVLDDDTNRPVFSSFGLNAGTRTTLRAGDITFVQYSAKDPDSFAFVTFVDILPGTVIKFTDHGWDNNTGTFTTFNEGILQWTAPDEWITAGQIVTIDFSGGTTNTSTGTVAQVDLGFSLAEAGDQVLAFQDTSSSTTFLAGISWDYAESGWMDAGNPVDASDSYCPPGLIEGDTAITGQKTPSTVSCVYYGSGGAPTTGTTAFLRQNMANLSGNWMYSETSALTVPGTYFNTWRVTVLDPEVYIETTDAGINALILTGMVQDAISGIYKAGGTANSPTLTVYNAAGAVVEASYMIEGPAANGDAQSAAEPLGSGTFALTDLYTTYTALVTAADYDVDRTSDSLIATQKVIIKVTGDDDTASPLPGIFEPGNLLRNSSFELQHEDGGANEALYWTYDERTLDYRNGGFWGSAARTDGGGMDGDCVGAICGTWYASTNMGGFWQQVTNEAGAGSVWEASAYVRAPSSWACTAQCIQVQFYDAGASNMLSARTNYFTPGEDWTRVAVTGSAPAAARWVRWLVRADGITSSGAGEALSIDCISLRVLTHTIMDFMIGRQSFYRSGYSSNALFRTTDGDLAEVSSSNMMKFIFSVYDADSGLLRSTSEEYLNYDIGNEPELQNIYSNYVAAMSMLDTRSALSTSVFAQATNFTVTGRNDVETGMVYKLMNLTNAITLSGRDADADRPNDEIWFTDSLYGRLSVSDDDVTGPYHWLIYVGDNFDWGAGNTGPISDAQMTSGLDIAYGIWDPSGILVTNTSIGSTNTDGNVGSVRPNWDLIRPPPDSSQIVANSVVGPTNIWSPKGNGSYNATVVVHNISAVTYEQNTIGVWRVRASSEDFDCDRGWNVLTNAQGIAETCSWDRAITSDQSFEFVVYDDDTNAPLLTGLSIVSGAHKAGATDLLISEYIEGSSNNKYLELYNGTTGAVDMSQYKIAIYFDGSSTTSGVGNPISLSGILPPGGIYVIANSSATNWTGTPDKITGLNFNGNDAVLLLHNGATVDVLGVVGNADVWGADQTMLRNINILNPSPLWVSNDWTRYPVDTVSYLGNHMGPVTDGDLASADLTITGNVQDVGSGIYVSANEPRYTLKAPGGGTIVNNKTFAQKPATDGDGQTASVPLSDPIVGFNYANITLGTYTATVNVTDYDVDRISDTATLSRTTAFVVIDDDTNKPLLGTGILNLLSNPGFEVQSAGGETNALYWDTDFPNDHGAWWGVAERLNWEPRLNGTWTMNFRAQDYGVKWTNNAGIWQEVTNTTAVGTLWEASAWVRNDDGIENPRYHWTSDVNELIIEFYDGENNRLTTSTNRFKEPGATWTLISVTATTVANTAWARFVMNTWGIGNCCTGVLRIDDVVLRPLLSTGVNPLAVRVQDRWITGSDTTSNALFTVTDGDLGYDMSAERPFMLYFNAYDADSGLSRGTTDNSTQMNVTVVNLATNNVANYSAGNSVSFSDTRNPGAYSVWKWTSIPSDNLQSMIDAGSNEIRGTLFDADNDRVGDQLANVSQRFGFLKVVDDDVTPPLATGLCLYAINTLANTTNLTDGLMRNGQWYIGMFINDPSHVSTTNQGDWWGLNYSLINPAGVTCSANYGFDRIFNYDGTNYYADRNWAGEVAYSNNMLGVWRIAYSAQDQDNDRPNDWTAVSNSHNIAGTSNLIVVIDDDTNAPLPPSDFEIKVTGWTNVNRFEVRWKPGVDADSGIAEYRAYTNETPTNVQAGILLTSGFTVTNEMTSVLITNGDFEVGYDELAIPHYPLSTNGWTVHGYSGAYFDNAVSQSGSNSIRFSWVNTGSNDDWMQAAQDVWIQNTSNSYGIISISAAFHGNLSAVDAGAFCKIEYKDAATNHLGAYTDEWMDAGLRKLYRANTGGGWSNVTWIATNMPPATQIIRFGVGARIYGVKAPFNCWWDNITCTVKLMSASCAYGVVITNAPEAAITQSVFVVDADDDRPDDRLRSIVTNFPQLYDATPPLTVTNFSVTEGTDTTSEIFLQWNPLPNGGGNNLSPWRTYAIFYTEEDRDPVLTDPHIAWDSGNYGSLATNTTSAITLTNFAFGSTYRFAIAGWDQAGNIGMLSTSPAITLAGFSVTQGVVLTTQPEGPSISWTATNRYGNIVREFDLLYVDAMDFTDALSNQWKLLTSVMDSCFMDTGWVDRTPPHRMVNTMRFYRAAQHDQWKLSRSQRAASVEIYGMKTIRLVPGQNWVGLPFIPDSNSVKTILGYDLPGAEHYVNATRVIWTKKTNTPQSRIHIWLSKNATNPPSWQHVVTNGPPLPADDLKMPLEEGFIIQIPTNGPKTTNVIMFVGRVPTNSTTYTIQGGGKSGTYHMVSMRTPNRLHPGNMNLAGVSGTADNIPLHSERIWSLDRISQRAKADVWYDAKTGRWRLNITPNFPNVPTNYFGPDDALVFYQPTNKTSGWTWTLPRPYSPPTKNMTP